MNRRIFLKATGITAILSTVIPTTKILAKKEEQESKWIAFKDQIPKSKDKFEIKNLITGQITRGTILKFKVEGEDFSKEEKKFYFKEKTYILQRNSLTCMEVIKQEKWNWRYI